LEQADAKIAQGINPSLPYRHILLSREWKRNTRFWCSNQTDCEATMLAGSSAAFAEKIEDGPYRWSRRVLKIKHMSLSRIRPSELFQCAQYFAILRSGFANNQRAMDRPTGMTHEKGLK